MADVVTETSVVQVTLLDAAGYVKTINLDKPKENLSLNEIKAAFQPAINGRWLYGRADLVVEVQKATYSTSTKIPIAGGEVSITPNAYTLSSIGTNLSKTTLFSIENSSFTSGMIKDLSLSILPSGSNIKLLLGVGINSDGTLYVAFNQVNNHQGTTPAGTYTITGSAILSTFFVGGSYDIPITIDYTYTHSV